jgi:hypothetical protein
MVLELLVVRGPHAGQQIQIGAGQVVRIGRTDRSHYALSNDTYLSGAHFEIGCDERECRIRDLGSANGTFVNGAKVAEQAAVHEGDQIAAGETIFLVQAGHEEQRGVPPTPVLASAAAAAAAPPVSPERTARMYAPGFEPKPQQQPAPLSAERRRVQHILTHQAAPLYAVLDTARDAGVLLLLRQSSPQSSPPRYQPLFESEIADPLASHAPVLVDLGYAGLPGIGAGAQTFLEAVLRSGWGQSWGIWLTSPAPFEDLLAHLRGFLFARTRDQQPLYFRLYDPRILRAFLPVCEPQELSAIFGPVVSYLVESERPDGLLAFSRGATGLITTQISLAEQPAQAQAGAV